MAYLELAQPSLSQGQANGNKRKPAKVRSAVLTGGPLLQTSLSKKGRRTRLLFHLHQLVLDKYPMDRSRVLREMGLAYIGDCLACWGCMTGTCADYWIWLLLISLYWTQRIAFIIASSTTPVE